MSQTIVIPCKAGEAKAHAGERMVIAALLFKLGHLSSDLQADRRCECMKPEKPPSSNKGRMIDYELLNQLNDLLRALVQRYEVVTEFSSRGVFRLIAECSSEEWAIEKKSALRHKQADTQAMNDLASGKLGTQIHAYQVRMDVCIERERLDWDSGHQCVWDRSLDC